MAKEKICGIYKIQNIVNGKIYIGQSVNISDRWFKHKSCLRGDYHINKHLQSSWNKYGENSFTFDIIEQCTEEKLVVLEQKWMDFYKSYDNKYGYNNEVFASKIAKTEEIKGKISKTLMGKYCGEKSPRASITEDIANNIVDMLITTNKTLTEIGKINHVSFRIVQSIYSHKQWKHLTQGKEFHTRDGKSESNKAKLNKNDVFEIKVLLKYSDLLQKQIANIFNINPRTISKINTNIRWSDVKIDNVDIKLISLILDKYNKKG